MQTIAWTIVCGALMVLAGSGCGGGDGGGGRPNISTSQATVCNDIADVACYNMFRCCSEGEIEEFLGVSDPRTEDECRDDVRTICERQTAALDFSIDNDRVSFDASILNTCLESLTAPEDSCATIAAMLPWTEACLESAWIGTVAAGGTCDFAYECTEDSFCSTGRVCTALPGDGMPCAAQACATGLFCNVGTCRPLLAEGATCSLDAQCQQGLFCDTAVPVRTCTRVRNIGESCSGNTTCSSNTCLPGTCAGSLTTCFTATDCSGHCENTNAGCSVDIGCTLGTCSNSTTTCFSPLDCTPPATCEFPRCLPPECVGDVVCAEPRLTVDYCQGALDSLPFFQ